MNYSARVSENIPSYKAKLVNQNVEQTPKAEESSNPYSVNVKVEKVEYDADASDIQTLTKIVGDVYTGSYEVIPSQLTQTLQTADKILAGDVIIHPIPSNYGLITWNGAVLTVS